MRTTEWDDWVRQARSRPIEAEIERRGIKLRRQGKELIGACPECGGTDRFSINITKQVFNCRGCGRAGDVIDLVQWLDKVDFSHACEQLVGQPTVRAAQQTTDDHGDEARRIERAGQLWREAQPIVGTPGIVYLERERRIFDLPPDTHDVLRFHRRCIWGPASAGGWLYHHCILALYRDIVSNKPTGVHRIAIDAEGRLIGRLGLGRKQGSAVKLWGDAEVATSLVVGEGIETMLAAATGVHHRGSLLQPAWALIDAGNLAAFPVLAGIEHITVLGDNDPQTINKMTGAPMWHADGRPKLPGPDAARVCAKRWAEAGREAVVLMPDRLGEDFNDIAREARSR